MTKKQLTCAVLSAITMMTCQAVWAQSEPSETVNAEEEALDTYDAGSIEITKEEYSEENPYLTGGDVDVITREEIDAKHYESVIEAIRRTPGVQVSNPGYRGGEYGYSSFTTEFSINGDSSVIVTVDGRRLDNAASSYAGNRSKISPSALPGIDAIERIEVIKGTGTAMFGSDVTGGVINIVTRKGAREPKSTLDLATGSWGRHSYSFSHSGTDEANDVSYFFTLSRRRSEDSEYKDAYTDATKRFKGTEYVDDGATLRLDKEFDENHSLTANFSYRYEKAHYPITAADYRTIDLLLHNRQPFKKDPVLGYQNGYRNGFLYDAWLGSYNETKSNDLDLKYTFNKEDGMESFVRVYRNHRWYNDKDYSGLWGYQPNEITPEMIEKATNIAGHHETETTDGVALQWSKKEDIHNMTFGLDFRKSKYEAVSSRQTTNVERKQVYAFAQDKIELSDRWTVTPALKYSWNDSFDRKSKLHSNGIGTENTVDDSKTSNFNYSLYTNYKIDDSSDAYISWVPIFRPKSNSDFDRAAMENLEDEKGNSWTIGYNKNFSDRTSMTVNYAVTDMDNTIAKYSVWDDAVANPDQPDGTGDWVSKAVNAKQKKKAFNVGVNHMLSDAWSVAASYAYVFEDFSAKHFTIDPTDGSNIDALINRTRPANIYQLDLLYSKNKWSGDLAATVYSGLDTQYFTDSSFFVMGLTVNYDIDENTQAYFIADNLTNEAYETRVSSSYGPGAFPQPGRSFMFGVKRTF